MNTMIMKLQPVQHERNWLIAGKLKIQVIEDCLGLGFKWKLPQICGSS